MAVIKRTNRWYWTTQAFVLFFSLTSGAQQVFAAAPPPLAGLQKEINEKLANTANIGGYSRTRGDLATVIGGVIFGILSILGVVFVTLIVYAGFKWMLAQGEEQKIDEARNLIIHSIIGLAIILAAYAISYFIVDKLQQAV